MHSLPRRSGTRLLAATPDAISEAAALIRRGGLAAFPTETVYGLGANALDEGAVSEIFATKARPKFNPLIVHLLGLLEAEQIVEFNETAMQLAEAFWPGPLTLVLPRRTSCTLAQLTSAGLDTAAVRAPAHPVARSLLEAAGVPIAAPSANRSGNISPTCAKDVMEELGGRVEIILDGGACSAGLESTIIGFVDGAPVLLRKGAISRSEIEKISGPLRSYARGEITAPGMMRSHYAPSAKMRLNARQVEENEALLAFGPEPLASMGPSLNLSVKGDLKEAATNLFRMLRQLDKTGAHMIAVMPVPDTGLGEAINDRLARAASPRDGE